MPYTVHHTDWKITWKTSKVWTGNGQEERNLPSIKFSCGSRSSVQESWVSEDRSIVSTDYQPKFMSVTSDVSLVTCERCLATNVYKATVAGMEAALAQEAPTALAPEVEAAWTVALAETAQITVQHVSDSRFWTILADGKEIGTIRGHTWRNQVGGYAEGSITLTGQTLYFDENQGIEAETRMIREAWIAAVREFAPFLGPKENRPFSFQPRNGGQQDPRNIAIEDEETAQVLALDYYPTDYATPEEAAKALHAVLVKFCREVYEQDPDQEMFIQAPEQTRESLGYAAWRVCWEAGPYNWAVSLSHQLHTPTWFTEPYYSFDLTWAEA